MGKKGDDKLTAAVFILGCPRRRNSNKQKKKTTNKAQKTRALASRMRHADLLWRGEERPFI